MPTSAVWDDVRWGPLGARDDQHVVYLTEEGVGVARFVRLKDEPRVADPAVAVVDDFQGRGLGTLLLRRLVAAALERGVDRFRSELLASNEPVTGLLSEIGDEVSYEYEGSGVLKMELPLSPPEPHHRVLSHAARGAVSVRSPRTG